MAGRKEYFSDSSSSSYNSLTENLTVNRKLKGMKSISGYNKVRFWLENSSRYFTALNSRNQKRDSLQDASQQFQLEPHWSHNQQPMNQHWSHNQQPSFMFSNTGVSLGPHMGNNFMNMSMPMGGVPHRSMYSGRNAAVKAAPYPNPQQQMTQKRLGRYNVMCQQYLPGNLQQSYSGQSQPSVQSVRANPSITYQPFPSEIYGLPLQQYDPQYLNQFNQPNMQLYMEESFSRPSGDVYSAEYAPMHQSPSPPLSSDRPPWDDEF